MYYSDEKLDVNEMSSTKYRKYLIYVNQFAFRTTQKVPKQAQKPAIGCQQGRTSTELQRNWKAITWLL